ncbi:hypothetical protein ACWGH4_13945 [Streptomyces sp. NPDC054847]
MAVLVLQPPLQRVAVVRRFPDRSGRLDHGCDAGRSFWSDAHRLRLLGHRSLLNPLSGQAEGWWMRIALGVRPEDVDVSASEDDQGLDVFVTSWVKPARYRRDRLPGRAERQKAADVPDDQPSGTERAREA